MIYTHSHSAMSPKVKISDLRIGSKVTIGSRAIIMPSCNRIGDGATICPGSVVFEDVPANVQVRGNPARIVRIYMPFFRSYK